MSETQINVELLEKVKAHILEEPRRFNMREWFVNDLDDLEMPLDERPACGTVACIAGWACVLSGIDPSDGWGVSGRARRELGLSDMQAEALFKVSLWPAEFEASYDNAETPARRAEVAVERIDHFIATNGAE